MRVAVYAPPALVEYVYPAKAFTLRFPVRFNPETVKEFGEDVELTQAFGKAEIPPREMDGVTQ